MILRERIEFLKRSLPVPEYFRRQHFSPKRTGRRFVILCPFHKEKTPSCFLYEDHYHCFGCNRHGDVIDAHRKLTSVDFQTALEELGQMAGLNQYHPEWAPGQTGRIKTTRKESEK